uniref:Polygalacturonase n=1 Tax=Kalanchoe fedtschenkoi TaxID=63787 RepID=A0A7N0U0R3_KALFE
MAIATPSLICLLLLVTSFVSSCSASASLSYNVVTYGAKPSGNADSTKAFVTAWNLACNAPRSAMIYVPPGTFLLKSVNFVGPCNGGTVTFRIDGTLVAPSDFKVIGDNPNWLFFQNLDGVSIVGGVLDGRGGGLWDCKNSGKSCPSGATSIGFSRSKNVEISGLTSLNSQMFHIVINGCENVKLQGVKVNADGESPNTDGIHVQMSSGVTILGAKIKTGDDCVSIGPGTNNLWIENVACGPGHGISIGSLGKESEEPGVQNVTVRSVTFTGSQNGLRIKSWGRPSTGFVRNVLFQHALMVDVENPIVIDQNYCPDHKGCPGKASGVRISGVTYQDIHGTSATEVAVKLDCSSKNPCSQIKLQDVKLSYNKQGAAQASCSHVDGTVSGIVEPSGCFS